MGLRLEYLQLIKTRAFLMFISSWIKSQWQMGKSIISLCIGMCGLLSAVPYSWIRLALTLIT